MRRKFGHIKQLRQQKKFLNEVAEITIYQRKIFYLITKEHQYQKPTYQAMFRSLQNCKLLCTEYQITNLACPRLRCGLNGLQWETVQNMLRYIFRNSKTKVHLYTKDEMTQEEKYELIKEFIKILSRDTKVSLRHLIDSTSSTIEKG